MLREISKIRRQIAAIAWVGLLSIALQSHLVADEWHWSDVERVVAVGDVHGAYGAMTETLARAGILDGELAWSGGATHLVFTGDVLDRGPDSRKAMDLIMRLEGQALDAGGRVHMLLGNHEVMNMIGDLRYVSKEEFAAFSDHESAKDRERSFKKKHGNNNSIGSKKHAVRNEFAKKYPPGFFGLRRAFGTEGIYGQWLLSKPIMIVINGTAFVHGGLSSLVAEIGLDGVNRTLKSQVSDYISQVEVLIDVGILNSTDSFYRHSQVLESLPSNGNHPEHVNTAIETVIKLNDASVHSQRSPLWYRGTVGCGPLIEQDKLTAALEAIGANRVVVGHTTTLTRQVLERMDGRVVEIDTGMLNFAYGGSGNALIIEGDSMSVVGEKTSAPYVPVAHPRRVGYRSETLSADTLQEILANGELSPTATPDVGKKIYSVTHLGENISAVFEKKPRARGVYPDLAAYRLDVLLGLGMVPVTVAREIAGEEGSLQFMPGSTMNDEDRAARIKGGAAWCPLAEQWQAMYIFDSLIYNEGRQRKNMLYSTDNWQLILAGHRNTFSTSRGLPIYVANMEDQTGNRLVLGGGWKKALSELTDDHLAAELSDALDTRRIRALGRRRDNLLKR